MIGLIGDNPAISWKTDKVEAGGCLAPPEVPWTIKQIEVGDNCWLVDSVDSSKIGKTDPGVCYDDTWYNPVTWGTIIPRVILWLFCRLGRVRYGGMGHLDRG